MDMSSKSMSQIVEEQKERLRRASEEDQERAKTRLIEVMGDELNSITAITYDQSIGKFKNVEAPEHAKAKLREVGLLDE